MGQINMARVSPHGQGLRLFAVCFGARDLAKFLEQLFQHKGFFTRTSRSSLPALLLAGVFQFAFKVAQRYIEIGDDILHMVMARLPAGRARVGVGYRDSPYNFRRHHPDAACRMG